ncbi:MAG: hypothetical protein F9K30_02450 [Dechloromonas sp.]|nr:MAG: hypothetical protein F9K30_02450 [Dechloromonas sp.]
MSILSDLDPQYARIQSPPAPGRKWSLSGLLALILACGAGGIYFAYSFSSDIAQPPVESPAARAATTAQAAESPPMTADAPHGKHGAALIQRSNEILVAENSAEPVPANAFRALQVDTPPTSGKAADKGNAVRKETTKTRTAKEPARKTAKSNQGGNGPVKSARNNDVQQKKKLSSKPAERDIDIISAIVK